MTTSHIVAYCSKSKGFRNEIADLPTPSVPYKTRARVPVPQVPYVRVGGSVQTHSPAHAPGQIPICRKMVKYDVQSIFV